MARPRTLSLPRVADTDAERALQAVRAAVAPVVRMELSERVAVPRSATARGEPWQYAADDAFLYVCIAPGKWRRVALEAW